jgi:hypothetical protein
MPSVVEINSVHIHKYQKSVTDINDLQDRVLLVITEWSRHEKTPISRKYLIDKMQKAGVKKPTIIGAISALLRKGYIRPSVVVSNKTFYIQLRSI